MNDSSQAGGMLCCYNQFPYHYSRFEQMTDALPGIATMGFKQVWVGPLHPVGAQPKASGERGSLYGMTDAWSWRSGFFETPEVDRQKAQLKAYTAKARQLGLAPMFDLVLKHMGKGSRLEMGDPFLASLGIDTKRWFKQEVFTVSGQTWDDVLPLNYDDPAIRTEIVEKLWKPYIRMYIEELGFQGMRIDAAQHLPADVVKELITYAEEVSLRVHNKKPVVLAEVLGSDANQRFSLRWHDLEGVGITHISNYAYWLPNRQEPEYQAMTMPAFREVWQARAAGFNHEKGEAQQVVRLTTQHASRAKSSGGTVGFADFHDDISLAAQLRRAGVDDRLAIEKALREKAAIAAFSSDAGWFVSTGFEWADSRSRSVFDDDVNRKPVQKNGDMRRFIAEINHILAKQPPLSFPNWSERLFLDKKPDLVIINTHDGEGFSGPSYLRIVNIDPSRHVRLDASDVNRLAEMSGKRAEDFSDATQLEAHGIFVAGGVKISGALLGPVQRRTEPALSR